MANVHGSLGATLQARPDVADETGTRPACDRRLLAARRQPPAYFFTTVTVICDGYCLEWCTLLRATTLFVSS
jgi:hypothetical protein